MLKIHVFASIAKQSSLTCKDDYAKRTPNPLVKINILNSFSYILKKDTQIQVKKSKKPPENLFSKVLINN